LDLEDWSESLPLEVGGISEAIEWAYDQVEFICYEVLMRPVSGIDVPWVGVRSNYGDWSYVPLFGWVAVELSEERFCSGCFRELTGGRGVGVCKHCYKWDEAEGAFCIAPRCCSATPFCNERSMKGFRGREFVLYCGCFGDVIQVGMGCREALEAQLLIQGVDWAVTLRGYGGVLDWAEAYQVLQAIRGAYYFEPVDFFTKIQNLESPKVSVLHRIVKLVAELTQVYHLQEGEVYDLRGRYWSGPSRLEVYPLKGRWLVGNVKGAKGNVLFLEQEGQEYVFNLWELLGRKLKNVRG